MRRKDLRRFYRLIDCLENRLGEKYYLTTCENRIKSPHQGVYFFFENGENRSESDAPRIVKVGSNLTDGLYPSDTLWKRLRQHRGTIAGVYVGGGDHRQSVLRYYVGSALLHRDGVVCPTWDIGGKSNSHHRRAEHNLECRVSQKIRAMPFM